MRRGKLITSGVPFNTATDDAKRKLAMEGDKLRRHRIGVLWDELRVVFAAVFFFGLCGPLGVFFHFGKIDIYYQEYSHCQKFFADYVFGAAIPFTTIFVAWGIYNFVSFFLRGYFQEKIVNIRARWNPTTLNLDKKISEPYDCME